MAVLHFFLGGDSMASFDHNCGVFNFTPYSSYTNTKYLVLYVDHSCPIMAVLSQPLDFATIIFNTAAAKSVDLSGLDEAPMTSYSAHGRHRQEYFNAMSMSTLDTINAPQLTWKVSPKGFRSNRRRVLLYDQQDMSRKPQSNMSLNCSPIFSCAPSRTP